MLRQHLREWTDARNADNRRHDKPCRPVSELVSFRQPLGLDHFALAVYPLGFYGVKPRTLLGQRAAYDPHSTATVFDSAVMLAEPASDLLGDLHFPAAERTPSISRRRTACSTRAATGRSWQPRRTRASLRGSDSRYRTRVAGTVRRRPGSAMQSTARARPATTGCGTTGGTRCARPNGRWGR